MDASTQVKPVVSLFAGLRVKLLQAKEFWMKPKGKPQLYYEVEVNDGKLVFRSKTKVFKNVKELGESRTHKFDSELQFWVSSSPVNITIRLYNHKDLIKDKKLGMVTLTIREQVDLEETKWMTLEKEAPNDKVSGSVEVYIRLQFRTNFKTYTFPTWCHMTLIPSPVNGMLYLQGNLTDVELLQILDGTALQGIPNAVYKDSKIIAWEVPVSDSISLWEFGGLYSLKNRAKVNKLQNALFSILNNLSGLGFELRKADHIHMVWVGSGKNRRLVERYDPTLWMVKTRSNFDVDTRYILVEPGINWGEGARFFVELQGNIPQAVMGSLISNFSRVEEIKTNEGMHLSWSLVIEGINSIWSFGLTDLKRKENIHQNFMLKVFDCLAAHGFHYVTCWGNQHIFSISTETVARPQGKFVLVDPFFFGSIRNIELQGSEVDQNFAVTVATMLGVQKVEAMKDKKDNIIHWAIPVDVNYGITFNLGEMRKRQNKIQNNVLTTVSKISAMGYDVRGCYGRDCILLQRNPLLTTFQSLRNFILVDIQYTFGSIIIELQGNFTQEIVVQLAAACNITNVKKVEDTKSFYCWSLEIPESHGFATQVQRNKIQHYMMMIITWLHNQVCYEPVFQYGAEPHAFSVVLSHNPQRIPGNWIYIDFKIYPYCGIEIQGSVDANTIAILNTAGVGNASQMTSNNIQIGWLFPLKGGMNFVSQWGIISKKDLFLKEKLLKIVNKLVEIGWYYCFQLSEGVTPGGMFFKPTQTIANIAPMAYWQPNLVIPTDRKSVV